MKNKNLPAIVMLCAGAIASICSIVNNYTFLNTLKVTLAVLIIFYVIGVIAGKLITRINNEANKAYVLKKREELREEAILEQGESNFEELVENEDTI